MTIYQRLLLAIDGALTSEVRVSRPYYSSEGWKPLDVLRRSDELGGEIVLAGDGIAESVGYLCASSLWDLLEDIRRDLFRRFRDGLDPSQVAGALEILSEWDAGGKNDCSREEACCLQIISRLSARARLAGGSGGDPVFVSFLDEEGRPLFHGRLPVVVRSDAETGVYVEEAQSVIGVEVLDSVGDELLMNLRLVTCDDVRCTLTRSGVGFLDVSRFYVPEQSLYVLEDLICHIVSEDGGLMEEGVADSTTAVLAFISLMDGVKDFECRRVRYDARRDSVLIDLVGATAVRQEALVGMHPDKGYYTIHFVTPMGETNAAGMFVGNDVLSPELRRRRYFLPEPPWWLQCIFDACTEADFSPASIQVNCIVE